MDNDPSWVMMSWWYCSWMATPPVAQKTAGPGARDTQKIQPPQIFCQNGPKVTFWFLTERLLLLKKTTRLKQNVVMMQVKDGQVNRCKSYSRLASRDDRDVTGNCFWAQGKIKLRRKKKKQEEKIFLQIVMHHATAAAHDAPRLVTYVSNSPLICTEVSGRRPLARGKKAPWKAYASLGRSSHLLPSEFCVCFLFLKRLFF